MNKKLLVFILMMIISTSIAFADVEIINIYKSQQEVVKVPTSDRVYVIDENIVSVNMLLGKYLELNALNLGKTVVFLWDKKQIRHDYVVKVLPKKLHRKTVADSKKDKPFRYGISLGTSLGESKSKYDSNEYKYASNYYVVDAYGNTPAGFFKGQLGYKTRVDDVDDLGEITSVLLQLEKGVSKTTFGDQVLGYSDYVLPRQGVQGLSYKTKLGKLSADFFHGVNKHGWWGSDIFRDHRNMQHLSALNLSYPLKRRSKIGVNALFKDDDYYGDEAIYGVYADYQVNRYLGTLGEYAINDDKSASKLGLSYNKDGLGVYSTYRNSNKDYNSASDYISYQGKVGLFNDIRWSGNRSFIFRANYDQYVDNRYYSGNYLNKDGSVGLDYLLGAWVFNYSYWNKARKYDLSTYDGAGHNFQITRKFGQNRAYYKFTPSNYDADYSGDDEKTYDQTSSLLGVQFKLWRAFVTFEQEYKSRNVDDTSASVNISEDENISKFRVKFSLSDFKLKDRYYLTLLGRYENSNGDEELERFYNYIKTRVDYKYASDKKVYIEYARTETLANESQELDSILQELKLGMTWFWDTEYKYTGRNNMVAGVIYFDENGNGEADPDEEGISGVSIEINGKEYRTDINGKYIVKHLENENVNVNLSVASLPKGYSLTTPSKYNLKLGYSDKVQLDFGTSAFAKVRGLVFVDTNSNSVYDAGERLIESVGVTVKGITENKSDSNGTITFSNVPAGEHDFRLNVHTIPSDLLPAGDLSFSKTVSPGETVVIYFPLKYNN